MHIIIHKIIIPRCAFLFAGIDIKKNVVGIIIFPVGIMAVVGGNHRHIILLGEFEKGLIDGFLLLYVVPLQFNKVIFSKKIQPPFEFDLGFFLPIMQNSLRNIGTYTTGSGD